MISAVVIEDSRLARNELVSLLGQLPKIMVVGEADSVAKGIALIDSLRPQLVFLDINLPGGNGFDIISSASFQPAIIFTTAYHEHALKSFEHRTLDYLLKPVSLEKLQRAVHKAEIFLGKESPEETAGRRGAQDRLLISDRRTSHLARVGEIRFFESKGNYTQVHFGTHQPLLQKSIQQLIDTLEDGLFLRINRGQLVNIDFIKDIIRNTDGKMAVRLSSGEELSVSRRQMGKLKRWYSR